MPFLWTPALHQPKQFSEVAIEVTSTKAFAFCRVASQNRLVHSFVVGQKQGTERKGVVYSRGILFFPEFPEGSIQSFDNLCLIEKL